MKERDIILEEYKILIEYMTRFVIVICCIYIINKVSGDYILTFAIAILMSIWVLWDLIDKTYKLKTKIEKGKYERK